MQMYFDFYPKAVSQNLLTVNSNLNYTIKDFNRSFPRSLLPC